MTWFNLDPFLFETAITGPCILSEDQFDNLDYDFDPEDAASRKQWRDCTALPLNEPVYQEYQCSRCNDPTFIDPNWDPTRKLEVDDLEESFINP